MCGPDTSQASRVSPLHVLAGRPGISHQERLLQWAASRVPGHGDQQARQPPDQHHSPHHRVSVKRKKLSTVGADGQSMLRHTPRLRASPHTELTTQIHTSRGRIIVIQTRHATAGRTTMVPTSPSMPHK